MLALALFGCGDGSQEQLSTHKSMAAKYLREGQTDKAVLELQTAQQIAPEDKAVLSQLGVAYLEAGHPVEAHRVFTQLVALDAEDLDAQLALGKLHLLANAPRKARERAEAVLAADPRRGEAHLLLGGAYLQEGRTDEADAEFRRATALDPENLTYRVMQACALLSVGQVADARSVLNEALAQSPKDTTCLLLLAQIAQLQRDTPNVESAFDRLLDVGLGNPSVWLAYGVYQLVTGRTQEARSAFRTASDLDSHGTTGWEQLAEIYLAQGGLLEAGAVVSAILDRNPVSVAGAYYQGQVLLGAGDFAGAAANFRKVLGLHPGHAGALYFLGMADYGQPAYQLAKAEIGRAIEQNPRFHQAQLLLAQIHLELREFREALSLTDELIAAPVVHREALMIRGTALLRLGNAAEAKKIFDRVLSIDPRDVRAWELRILCQEVSKQKQIHGIREILGALSDAPSGNIYRRLHGKEIVRKMSVLDTVQSLGFFENLDGASKQYPILSSFLRGMTNSGGSEKILRQNWSLLTGRAFERLPSLERELVDEVTEKSGEDLSSQPLRAPEQDKSEFRAASHPQQSRDAELQSGRQPNSLPVTAPRSAPGKSSVRKPQGQEEPDLRELRQKQLEVASQERADQAWDQANKVNTAEAYRDFRNRHPRHPKAEEGGRKAKKLEATAKAYRAAAEAGSVTALEAFLREYGGAPQQSEAQRLLRELQQKQIEEASRHRAAQAWGQANKVNTAEAYRDFRNRHPQHPKAEEAGRKAKKLEATAKAYRAAAEAGSVAALEAFLREYGDAPQRSEAQRLLSELQQRQLEEASRQRADQAWEQAQRLHTAEAYRYVRGRYPQHPMAEEAGRRADELEATAKAYRAAAEAGSVAALEAFLREYGGAPQQSEAQRLLRELQRKQVEEASRQRADQAWEQAQSLRTAEAYRGFRGRYPQHPMAEEAGRRSAVLGGAAESALPSTDPTSRIAENTQGAEGRPSKWQAGLSSPEIGHAETGADDNRLRLDNARGEGTASADERQVEPDTPEGDPARGLSRAKRRAIELYRKELQGK